MTSLINSVYQLHPICSCGFRDLSAYFSDYFRLAQSIQTVFHRGGSKTESGFFHNGSLCGARVISLDGDCLRVTQLILAVGQTRDRTGRPLLVCRHRGKHSESLSHSSNSRNSPKNRIPHTGNRSETAPLAMSYHVG